MIKEKVVLASLSRGSLEAFFMRSLGVGLLFLMHSALGRLLGPQEYGTFSYAISLGGLLAVIVSLGWPTALTRFISQYVEQQQWGLLKGTVIRGHQFPSISALLAAVVLWGASFWNFLPCDLVVSLRYTVLILPLLTIIGLLRRAYLGLQRVKTSITVGEIIIPLLVICGLYLFGINTASSVVLVYFGAAFLVSLFGLAWLWRSLPLQCRTVTPEFQTRIWMVTTLPMLLGGMGQIIMNRTSVLLLGAMADMNAVGLYSAANRIAVLNTFIMTAVNTIGAPMLASAYYGGRPEHFQLIMRKTILWTTFGTLPLFGIMIIWPQKLLGFFGQEFTQGILLLQILALGQFINSATGLVGSALTMTGHERTFAWATGTVAVGNILGNLIAISIWGTLGAAMATSFSVIVLNLTLLVCVWRGHGMLKFGLHK